MSQICNESYSFFETIEFVAVTFHTLTVIEIPIHLFVGYLILFKTPESMKSVKWPMFNVHFWSALLDISFSFLTSPYILFPHVAGYGAGFLMWLGVGPFVQTTIVVIGIGSTILSIAVLFENRYTILASSDKFWSQIRKFTIANMYVVAWTYFIPFHFLLPDQEEAVPVILKRLPQLHCFYSGPVFVIALDVTLIGWVTATKIIIEFLFIGIMGFLTFMSIMTRSRNVNLSRNTIALQRKFFVSITIQTLIPVAIIAGPLLCCALSLLQNHYSQVTVLSILVLFENRYTILASSSRISSRIRKAFIGFLYLFAVFYFIPFILFLPDQEVAVPALLEKLPSLRCFYTGPIYVLILDATVIGWTTTFKLFVEFLFIGTLGILSFLSIRDQNKNINLSRKTLALQKKLFMSLIFQTGIPFAVIILPLVYCAYSVVFDYYSQAMNNVCFLIISNHGLLTTFAIMIIHKPYREAAFPCASKKRRTRTEMISVILPTLGGND